MANTIYGHFPHREGRLLIPPEGTLCDHCDSLATRRVVVAVRGTSTELSDLCDEHYFEYIKSTKEDLQNMAFCPSCGELLSGEEMFDGPGALCTLCKRSIASSFTDDLLDEDASEDEEDLLIEPCQEDDLDDTATNDE